MKLVELNIKRQLWGDTAGTFTGTAKFDGQAGEIKLNLNDHHIEQLFLTCADGIVEVAKAAARMFVQEALANTEVARQRQLVSNSKITDIEHLKGQQ